MKHKGILGALVLLLVSASQVSSYKVYRKDSNAYRRDDYYLDRYHYDYMSGKKSDLKDSEMRYEESIGDSTIRPTIALGRPFHRRTDEEDNARKLIQTEYVSHDKFSVTMDIHKILKGRLLYKYLLVGSVRWLENTRRDYTNCSRFRLNSLKTWWATNRGETGAYLIDINRNVYTDAQYLEKIEDGRYVKKYTVGAEKNCERVTTNETRCNGPLYAKERYFVAVMACSRQQCISVGYLDVKPESEILAAVGRIACIVGGVMGIIIILLLVVKIIRLVQKKKRLQSTFRNAEIIGNNEAGKDSKSRVLGKVRFISHIPEFLESGSPTYQHLLN